MEVMQLDEDDSKESGLNKAHVQIVLESKDGREFVMSAKDASLSNMLGLLLHRASTEPKQWSSTVLSVMDPFMLKPMILLIIEYAPGLLHIPVTLVDGDTLALVVGYLNHHQGIQPAAIETPLRSRIMSNVCADSWYAFSLSFAFSRVNSYAFAKIGTLILSMCCNGRNCTP
jgi:hypothetical protein